MDGEEIRRLARCGPDQRWQPWVDAALERARILFRPRVRWRRVDPGMVESLFSEPSPVAEIARRGECWVFVATIGPGLEREVESHFAADCSLEALFLDAAGSSAVEALCDLAEDACCEGGATARFSPGYCAWSVLDQDRLFDLLEPGDLGVELLPSRMMNPVKTVTGLIVRGVPEGLRVPPESCESCDAQGCTRRQARRKA